MQMPMYLKYGILSRPAAVSPVIPNPCVIFDRTIVLKCFVLKFSVAECSLSGVSPRRFPRRLEKIFLPNLPIR